MKTQKILAIGFLVFLYPACTNLQIGQTAQRFYDNMHGGLRSFNNITPTPSTTQFSFSAMADTHIGSDGGNLFQVALTKSKNDGDSFAVVAGDDSNTGAE